MDRNAFVGVTFKFQGPPRWKSRVSLHGFSFCNRKLCKPSAPGLPPSRSMAHSSIRVSESREDKHMRSLNLAKLPLILLLLFALPQARAQESNPEEHHDPRVASRARTRPRRTAPRRQRNAAHSHTRRPAALLQSHRRHLADVRPQGRACRQGLLRVLHRGERRPPSDNLCLQWRPGCWRRVSAPGRDGTACRAFPGEWRCGREARASCG